MRAAGPGASGDGSAAVPPAGLGGLAPLWSDTRALGALFAVAFAATPLLAYLGPLGFPLLVAAAGLLAAPLLIRRHAPGVELALLGALWLWAALSYDASPAAPRGVGPALADVEALTALKLLFQLALYGLFATAAASLSGTAARRALTALGMGLAVLALLLIVEGISGAALYQAAKAGFEDPIRPDLAVRNVGQGSVVLALFAWPIVLTLRGRHDRWLIALLVGAVLAPPLLAQTSAVAALLAGGLAFWAVSRFGAPAARALGGLVVLAWLAAPWVVGALDDAGVLQSMRAFTPASTDARLGIWAFAAERVAERPWGGWGLDSSRALGPAIPLHPHDAPLQLWLELGLAGAVLAALVWAALFERLARAARSDRVGAGAAAGAAIAYFTVGALSFGVWQEWWLALGALTAAVCAALLNARRRDFMAAPPDAPGAALRARELQPL